MTGNVKCLINVIASAGQTTLSRCRKKKLTSKFFSGGRGGKRTQSGSVRKYFMILIFRVYYAWHLVTVARLARAHTRTHEQWVAQSEANFLIYFSSVIINICVGPTKKKDARWEGGSSDPRELSSTFLGFMLVQLWGMENDEENFFFIVKNLRACGRDGCEWASSVINKWKAIKGAKQKAN